MSEEEQKELSILSTINKPDDLKTLSTKELELLCLEIRTFLINSVSKTGGHFSSNLGMVETTVALHYLLNSPSDKIIFDVGHQAYTHKILTGRLNRFNTLRKKGGMSGFPRREESEHDIVSAGHASVSISTGLGILTADRSLSKSNKVVCIIGDGSITGGLSFEALNHAGHLQKDLIIILNDNEMSIDKNVGALHNYLSTTTASKTYQNIRKDIERFFDILPFGLGKPIYKFGVRCKKALKAMFFKETIFSDLGFEYSGPINGHNLKEIIKTLENAIEIERPVVIHIITKKGIGYKLAEEKPHLYHGVEPFNLEVGIVKKPARTYTSCFGKTMLKLAKKDSRVMAVSAAMISGSGLKSFEESYPNRIYDVGIAEAHAVAFASGLAIAGLKPIVAIYSTFMQRAVDQVIHDLSVQNLNVVIAMDRAGLVPSDGETHQGIYDIAIFKGVPNLIFIAPATESELENSLFYAIKQKCPVLIRYPKAGLISEEVACKDKFITGDGVFISQNKGADVLFLSLGAILNEVITACKNLAKGGVICDVYNLRFIAPLNLAKIEEIAKSYKLVVCVEEGIKIGGIGESIALHLLKQGRNVGFLNLGCDNIHYPHASRDELLALTGLSHKEIAKAVKNEIKTLNIREKALEFKNKNFN